MSPSYYHVLRRLSTDYNAYPLKLEVTYQYKTALMISKDKNIDFEQKENQEIDYGQE